MSVGRIAKARVHMSFTIDPEDHAALLSTGMSKTEFGREAIKHLLEHKFGHEAKQELARKDVEEAQENLARAVRRSEELDGLQEDFDHSKLLTAAKNHLIRMFLSDVVFMDLDDGEKGISLLLEKFDVVDDFGGFDFGGLSDEEKRVVAEGVWEEYRT